MTNEPKNVIWRWTPEPKQYCKRDDIAEEYAFERQPGAFAGIILWAKYRGEWHANPSERAVLAKLLSDIVGSEELTLERLEVDRHGKIDMSLSGEPAKRFFAALANLLEANDAQNFLRTVWRWTPDPKQYREDDDIAEGYAITVEKLHGADGPALKIRRLEQELAEARDKIQAIGVKP